MEYKGNEAVRTNRLRFKVSTLTLKTNPNWYSLSVQKRSSSYTNICKTRCRKVCIYHLRGELFRQTRKLTQILQWRLYKINDSRYTIYLCIFYFQMKNTQPFLLHGALQYVNMVSSFTWIVEKLFKLKSSGRGSYRGPRTALVPL